MDPSVDRALEAFERRSQGRSEATVALRALTLHMLSGLAPASFARRQLAGALRRALAAVRKVPTRLGPRVDGDRAMARLDAAYLRKLYGERVPPPNRPELLSLLARVDRHSPLHGWLLARLARKLGVSSPPAGRTADGCCATFEERVYFATHEVLLATDYCARPAPPGRRAEWVRRMRGAIPRLIREERLDAGAEVAFCLSLLGEDPGRLLRWLRARQRADGSLAQGHASHPWDALHTTAAALLALASAEEKTPRDPLSKRPSGADRFERARRR